MSAKPEVRIFDRTTPPHIVTLVLLAGLSAMSMNIFLPSLPNMTAYFDTEYRLIQLSVALYLGVNAVLQIFIGPISDKYGRRPVILWAIVLFLIATLGCILAPNVYVFLAFRMAQAVIVTGMALSRAVVRDVVPQNEAASMIGYVTMGMALVPMISPALGGVLDEYLGWQANFGALLLAGAGVLALVWFDLGETARPSSVSLGRQFREYPELLTSRRFWGYALVAAFSSGAFFAYLGGAPRVGTDVFGLSPKQLGLFFGAPAVGYLLGNYLSGRFSVRLGINRMILYGTLVVSAGMAMSMALMLAGFKHPVSFFGFMVLVGLGNGMTLPSATSGTLSVRPHLAGTAAGLGGAIMIGGGAALSAVAGAVLTEESGHIQLTGIMLVSSLISIGAMLYVLYINRVSGELTGAAAD